MAKLKLKNGREVDLRLEECPNGSVSVMTGNYYLLGFKSSGYIRCNCYVPNDLGLKVNDLGKIRMVK